MSMSKHETPMIRAYWRQIGGTLTRRLTALGHEVLVANSRGPQTLAGLAAETGAKAVSAAKAVRGVALVVVTIPQKNVPDLPAGLFAGVDPAVVVVEWSRENRIPMLVRPRTGIRHLNSFMVEAPAVFCIS
jgi:predicted dinucleotide-binding enzyme